MSSNILNKSFTPLHIKYDKRLVMANRRESLAKFVNDRMQAEGWSTYAVAEQSGHKISNGSVYNIQMGKTQDVKPTTLSALARGLKVPEEEIFAIAYGKIKAGDLTPDELRLVGYYRDIVPDRRPDVLAHVELMNQIHGQTNDIKEGEVKSGKAMRRELKGKKQNNKK